MNKAQLALEIHSERMAAFRLTENRAEPIAARVCAKKTDAGYKETLLDLLAECGDPDAFEAFSCSWSEPRSTLVPMMLFSESNPQALLNLTTHQPVAKEEIDYNRLPEWSIVNVYRIPMWIKSALIVKMPRIVIQHELSHLLRFLNTGSAVPLRAHVILQPGSFCLVVRKDGQIAHASYQSYQSAEDVLYHLLYTYKTLGIESKGELFLHGASEQTKETADRVRELTGSIELFRPQAVTTHLYEHIQYQSLCV